MAHIVAMVAKGPQGFVLADRAMSLFVLYNLLHVMTSVNRPADTPSRIKLSVTPRKYIVMGAATAAICPIRGSRAIRLVFAALGCILLASACSRIENAGSLQDIQTRKTLVVLTRNAPTTYYEGRDGQWKGLEHDMATAFAVHLGVEVRFEVRDTVAEILASLAEGEGDLAAAGLTKTPDRDERFLSGPVYQRVRQQVVCRRGGPTPRSVRALADVELAVAAESSYVNRLQGLEQQRPELAWRVSEELDTEQLLEEVWEEKLQCTVADSNIVAINRRYFPELKVAFHLSEEQPLVWLLPEGAKELKGELERWFREFRAAGALDALLEEYYGFIEIFDYVDISRFTRRIEETLPRYESPFKAAARKYDLSWTLLAAQAYQESHWRPKARSPTGVKGIMMLTLPTARELGVEDRLDPEQSIRAGARYLAELRERLPETIKEPDRTWMALAAYNVGMSHLYDARKLARRLDKNPNEWRDFSEVLPLLAQKRYYRTLKHGYARGSEPVQYVKRIRDYHDILERVLEK